MPSLLIASPQLQDPNFHQSVILLLEHDEDGALGFVINNKSHMTLNELISKDHTNVPDGISVWNAGPIGTNAGFVLHNKQTSELEKEIAPGVCLSSTEESLENLISEAKLTNISNEIRDSVKPDVLYPYRLLVGYSGWGAGQLDREIKQGTWILAPIDTNIIFDSLYMNIWQESLKSIGVESPHSLITPSNSSEIPPTWLH